MSESHKMALNGNAAKLHDEHNSVDDVIAKMRRFADRHWMHDSCQVVREYADMLEAAHKREVDNLNSVIQTQRSHFDAEIDRLRREEPPRNCERFLTWEAAKAAYWREQGDPADWRKLGAWLFAAKEEVRGEGLPRTEQESEVANDKA